MPAILDLSTRETLEALPFGVIVLEPERAASGDALIAFANQRAVALVGRALVGRSLAEAIPGETETGRANRFLDTILEDLPAMVFAKRASDLRFVRFNRAGEELLGLRRSQLLGRSDFEVFPPEQARFFFEMDRKVLAQGHVEDIPAEPIETPAGTRWLHTRKIPVISGGVPKYLLGVSIDITEVRRAEEALRTSHSELERRVAERTAALELEIEERRRAEAELRQLQEQLLQAQKMEAIGRLAGGVAHDFNNLLTVVLSYADLLTPAFSPGDRRRGFVEEIKRAGERGATLTRQLLAFSRQQMIERKVLDVAQIVEEMSPMIQRLVGENIELEVVLVSGQARVKADAGSLQQVILNLVVNARDAMPGGGKLCITVRTVDLGAAGARERVTTARGPHVLLEVTDTGVGMDQATQQRIFEPFFTTKPKGQGTGLGLATVFGVVTQAGGAIDVSSEPGAGTRFCVYLPRTDEVEAIEAPRRAPTAIRGTETILLAEDEAPLRQVIHQALEQQGFTVLVARDPGDAVARCRAHPGAIHLLLTDVVMPGMNGPELGDRITALRPAVKILYMSGYTEIGMIDREAAGGPWRFIAKPFTPDALLRRVREVLDER